MGGLGNMGLVQKLRTGGESDSLSLPKHAHGSGQYAAYLRPYSTALSTVAFSSLHDDTDPASTLVMKIFNVAVGAE